MKPKSLINRNIEIFYQQASEETRLDKGMGVFEFERIKTLIDQYLPSSSSTLIDVGGGTGKYAEWLAKKGHHVHLVEPIEKHLQIAQQRSRLLKNQFTVVAGEAQNLPFRSNFADLVILHGPLYHLQNKKERLAAIAEAKRVVKNKGIILGFAINNTASTLVGLLNGLLHKPSFFEMCKAELTTGMHNPPDDFPWLLAEAFYHSPEQFKEEFASQELRFLNLFAVEGMAWLDKRFFVNLQNPKHKTHLLELLRITESNPSLLAFSPHMMIATQKQQKHGK